MVSRFAAQWVLALGAAAFLSACEEGKPFNPFQNKDAAEETDGTVEAPARASRLIERDVEAPETFQVSEDGLWDGRPSLGGVWVAYSDVKDPERVIIRNEKTGKSVIGALFRRERENPGPRLQVSSDAADALGMLAGQPAKLNVTALRREEVADDPVVEEPAPLDAPEEIETTTIAPVAAVAAAAIKKADVPTPGAADASTIAAATAAGKAPEKPATPKASSLAKPFIQIGIFSVEANANNTATSLRGDGMVSSVKKSSAKGKTFWRVVVGPASSTGDRAALLKKVKALGFNDAYFVTN